MLSLSVGAQATHVPVTHKSTSAHQPPTILTLLTVCDWMASNRLKLNEEKTQIIWLGTRQQLDKGTV